MLIVEVYVNRRSIDNIYIHNTGIEKDGIWTYELINKKTNELLTPTTIDHKRSDGYRKLLIKVLELLEDEEIPTIPTIYDYQPIFD